MNSTHKKQVWNGSKASPEDELFSAGELDVEAGAEVEEAPPTP